LTGNKTPFVLSLTRIFPCAFVDESTVSLASYLKSSDDCIVMLDSDEKKDIEKWLWDILRGKLKSRSPFIVLGYESRNEFEKRNIAFYEKPHKYSYLTKPLNLLSFLKTLSSTQPLGDDEERRKDIFRYTNPLGRILNEVYTNLSHGEFHYSICYLKKQTKQIEIGSENYLWQDIKNTTDKIKTVREYLTSMINEDKECAVPDSFDSDKLRVKKMLSNLNRLVEEILEVLRGKGTSDRIKRLLGFLDRFDRGVEKINELRSGLQKV